MALNFLAFDGGWVFGGMFHEWWAGYVFVFTIAAAFSIALWVWWYVNVFIPTTLPLSQNEVLTINAVTISNLAAMLFVILIIPASCGVYFRRRKA